ncbi:hypothetical protein H8N03_21655 [Ramlibacter sp. USB13]|uniref:Uncharacterized protein n=1 Tax=Ramlibacter cellulosilyticus TaxID=2764187 RepID=A0A923SD18_9BURK|nr:hypothetical protein [Ramlibacter cellulosilyticus]MBC5785561.1 hypothetical protein [Ramlibacter cellulosilyticus]
MAPDGLVYVAVTLLVIALALLVNFGRKPGRKVSYEAVEHGFIYLLLVVALVAAAWMTLLP